MDPNPRLEPWKTWLLKNLNPEKTRKQLDTEKKIVRLHNIIYYAITENTENLLRRLASKPSEKYSLGKTENALKNKTQKQD